MKCRPLPVLILFGLVLFLAAHANAQQGTKALSDDPVCKSMKPTSMGGLVPQRPTTLVLRYLGASAIMSWRTETQFCCSNAYYYSRTARARALGFTREDIKRADALLLGHGHADHIADAQYLIEHLGVKAYGGPPTIEYLQSVHVPADKLVLWKGTES